MRLLPILLLVLPFMANAGLLMKPVDNPALRYAGNLLPGNYSNTITPPEKILGFEVGARVADPALINAAVTQWGEQSDRVKVVEYARSHEGRPLFALFISSPENLQKLDQIKANVQKLADPTGTSKAQADKLIEQLPAIAWMAYSIHGNETSGSDAALAAIYHLLASTDDKVSKLLDNMVVIIDPLMNPDGRARFANSLEQYRGAAPNIDNQSLLHSGDWPGGRTNHYFFDLNRDFIYLTQPETIGRVDLINQWYPQLMIDAHEMGSQDTFLMGPPRDPINTNVSSEIKEWSNKFAEDQAAAFDEKGWQYYTGEWFENLYPGYSNYAEYRGTMHILYEQARIAEDGVRRPEGRITTYKQSVHHQLISTLANLESLQKYSKQMYRDFRKGRVSNVSNTGKYAKRSFVVLANDNRGRMQQLLQRLLAQNIRVFRADSDFSVRSATNHLGETLGKTTVPAGSLIIPNRQPEAPLVAAMLEFDADIPKSVLLEERQKTLKNGSSLMYDATAWNMTMMYGLPALEVPEYLSRNMSRVTAIEQNTVPNIDPNALFWIADGRDDRSVGLAARLMEADIHVRVLDKDAELSGFKLNRGSVLISKTDNPDHKNLANAVMSEARNLKIELKSIGQGLGAGDLPDWGGRHFRLLRKPQIAILSHAGMSSNDVGVTWWSLDTYLGVRHSQINVNMLGRMDLRRYNTLVMPHGWGNRLDKGQKQAIRAWVQQGGTLIAFGNSSAQLAADKSVSGGVRTIEGALEKAEDYNLVLMREWLAQQHAINPQQTMQHQLDMELSYPWENYAKPLSPKALKKRNQWQRRFSPSGAFLAGRVDQEHWLTFGTDDVLPLLYMRQPILMSKGSAQAVVRAGVLKPRSNKSKSSNKNTKPKPPVSWYNIPKGQEMMLRMSGLLWPEAGQRIANSAYLTRERIGSGQLILFSGQPNYRAAALGTNRLMLNAIVYGHGLGSRAKVEL